MYTLNTKSIVFEEMCYIEQCIRRQFFLYNLVIKKASSTLMSHLLHSAI